MWTKTGVNHFSANSEQEMTDWICALQTVAFKDNVSTQTIEEDNDLYCSSGDGRQIFWIDYDYLHTFFNSIVIW